MTNGFETTLAAGAYVLLAAYIAWSLYSTAADVAAWVLQ